MEATKQPRDSDDQIKKKIKRKFYQEAVTMKLKLPANHPAKKILISELLDKVLAMNIP